MKRWKIGDKVKFVNEKGGGIIVAIKNEYEVIVQLSDGIEIPYPSKQLIPDDKNIILNPAAQSINYADSINNKIIYLAIESNTHKAHNATEYYVYLYNLSDYHFYYTYALGKNNTFQCLAHGLIHAFEKQRIKTLSHSLLKELDTHHLQMIFFQENLYTIQNPVFESIKLNEKTWQYQNFIHHPEFEHPVYILILKENFSMPPPELVQSHSTQNIKVHLSDEEWEKMVVSHFLGLMGITFTLISSKSCEKQK